MTGVAVCTDSAFSAAALSLMWSLNWTRIGAATPTVRPSPMLIVARTTFLGFTVWNDPASGAGMLSVPAAVPLQVYVPS